MKTKVTAIFKKDKKENLVNYRLVKSNLDPWKGDGATNLRNHVQAHERQDNHQVSCKISIEKMFMSKQ